MESGTFLLENGKQFFGKSVGGEGFATGEAVFNTSMSGYQEILTDPSYKMQIMVFTYPEIGNYGVRASDSQSNHIQVSGLLVRRMYECIPKDLLIHSNAISKNLNQEKFSSDRAKETDESLSNFLKRNGTIALEGIDTRDLTKTLRKSGTMRSIISSKILKKEVLMEKLLQSPTYDNTDLVSQVSCKKPYDFGENTDPSYPLIALIDFGVKKGILQSLDKKGARIRVYPSYTTAEQLKKDKIDGILLSNGPGNPATYTELIKNVKDMLGKWPIFGICLGNQILALAEGRMTFKLPFGHRGANHPIKTLGKDKVDISAQNHGYAIQITDEDQGQITHLNLNDNTVAGYKSSQFQSHAVQYHPEGAPGPNDSQYLFDDFLQKVKKFKKKH